MSEDLPRAVGDARTPLLRQRQRALHTGCQSPRHFLSRRNLHELSLP